MKVLSALKAAACLALAVNLCSCLASYDSGSDQEDNDIASDNVVITDNSVSDSEELLEDSPCDSLIWKPESEKDGNLALIFDAMFTTPFNALEVRREVMEEDAETEFETEFCALSSFDENGRQVWRCSMPGEAYTGEFRVEFGTESCEGEVANPAERSE